MFYQVVDGITCSLIKERLNNPATMLGNLAARSPADGFDLAGLLQGCSKSNSERIRKPHDFSFGDGEGDGNGSSGKGATSPVGNAYGQYPNSASSASSASGNGVGSGSGSAASSSGAQSSNSGSSGSSNGAKVPFNPTNAPNTITRRADSVPFEPAPPTPAEVTPKAAEPAEADIDADANFKRPKSSQHAAAEDEPERPTLNKSDTKHDSNPSSKCVGQAGSLTCGLQALGL